MPTNPFVTYRSFPDQDHYPSTVVVEAFGSLSRDPSLPGIIDDEDEDLYSVFSARGELMHWTSTLLPRPPHSLVWEMEEVELTAGSEGDMIGWVQVGLNVDDVSKYEGPPTDPSRIGIYKRPTEIALALPPLIQCFHDSLRRFGAVELSALQVRATYLAPSPRPEANVFSMQNWFNTTLKTQENALISFDQNFAGLTSAGLIPIGPINRPLEFGLVAAVPEAHLINVPFPEVAPLYPYRFFPALSGLSVKLPEWTPDAAAWALAFVTNAALVQLPDITHFAIRITRIP